MLDYNASRRVWDYNMNETPGHWAFYFEKRTSNANVLACFPIERSKEEWGTYFGKKKKALLH